MVNFSTFFHYKYKELEENAWWFVLKTLFLQPYKQITIIL